MTEITSWGIGHAEENLKQAECLGVVIIDRIGASALDISNLLHKEMEEELKDVLVIDSMSDPYEDQLLGQKAYTILLDSYAEHSDHHYQTPAQRCGYLTKIRRKL